MKKNFFVYFTAVSLTLFSAVNVYSQDTTSVGHDLKRAAHKTGKAISKGAKKIGNKTAEIASKGKSAVVDRIYDDKQGPNGEKIYIDGQSKYYYVDKKGHKKYVAENRLKDK